MTTTEEQAEFLDSIMQELEADPATTPEDKEILNIRASGQLCASVEPYYVFPHVWGYLLYWNQA